MKPYVGVNGLIPIRGVRTVREVGLLYEGLELGGRYRLESLLGRGGMGEVWHARDLRLGRAVAVKALPAWATADPAGAARFRREAEIAAGLQHPGITVVFDIGTDGSILFLVMELLTGTDLDAVLSDHPEGLPVRRALSMVDQLCDALAAAHAGGIVHRDIKPANVMVLDGDRLKICDFGIARFVASTTNLTGKGVIGTPSYMAPEQYEGEAVDGRTDLYALGCLTHQLLTGVPPFRSDQGVGALMRAHLTLPPPRIQRPDVSADLARLVTDLLAKDPAQRPAGAAQVRERLRAIDDRYVTGSATTAASATVPSPQAGADLEMTVSFRDAAEGGEWLIGITEEGAAERTLRLRIPAGITEGQRIRLMGTGAPREGGGYDGDRYVTVHVIPHPVFGRSGDHLTITVPITAEERTTGADIRVPTLTSPIVLRIPAGVSDGQICRIRGRGIRRQDGNGSDLLATVQVLPENAPDAGVAAREDLMRKAAADPPRDTPNN